MFRIIDEKGRIFGKINIIDFIVLLFLVLFLPFFYFSFKAATNSPSEADRKFVDIEVECQLSGLAPEIAKIILAQDKEVGDDGSVIGEIIELGKIEPSIQEVVTFSGRGIIYEDPKREQIMSKLKLRAEVKDNKLYYKDRPIDSNLPLEFKTDKYTISAIPKTAKDIITPVVSEMSIVLKDINEETLKLIAVGDKQLDKNGLIIAEILSLGKLEDSQPDFNLADKNFSSQTKDNKKQLQVKMKLIRWIRGGKVFSLNGERPKEDGSFMFETDKYKIKAVSFNFQAVEHWLKIKVKFGNLSPEIVNLIKPEDVETDPYGQIVCKIDSIESNKPSEVLILKENDFNIISHPSQRDLVIRMSVLAIPKEGISYFKNFPVKVGNSISFNSEVYSINNGTIIGFEM